MQCRIDNVSHQGEGVARLNGKAVFIPWALPGELVEAEVTNSKKRFSTARLIEILEPSPKRVAPLCPHFYHCGGCSYQHTDYAEELRLKTQVVGNALQRIGKVNTEVRPALASPREWRYRNKVTWHVAAGQLGYYYQDSHELLPIKTCHLISAKMEELSQSVARALPPSTFTGEIIVRQSFTNDETLLLLKDLPPEARETVPSEVGKALDSIVCLEEGREKTKKGNPRLVEQIGGLGFSLSPQAFFQVNHDQAEKLVELVLQNLELTGRERVLDAYCGIGMFTLHLARHAREVVGVEGFPAATADAEENARANGIANCRFLTGSCEVVLTREKEPFDAVVLDPPRSGCHPAVLQAIVRMAPSRIAYVSCHPATLARDLAILQSHGYQVSLVQPVDMFPRTHHVECVTLMSRVKE